MRNNNKIKEIYASEGIIGMALRTMKKAARIFFASSESIWVEKDLSNGIREVKPQIPVRINCPFR